MCIIAATVVLLTGCASHSSQLTTPLASGLKGNKTISLSQELSGIAGQIHQEYPKAKLPEFQIIRAVTPADWEKTFSQCMTDAGFPTKVDPNGGAEQYVAPGQEESTLLAQYKCQGEYPLQAKYREALTDTQLKRLYTYFTGTLTRCLQKNGVEVPATPSLQDFEQNYGTPQTWTPFQYVPVDKMTSIDRVCPQNPSNLYN